MNKLELFNRMTALEEEVGNLTEECLDFIQESADEAKRLSKKVFTSLVTSQVQNGLMTEEVKNSDVDAKLRKLFDVEYMENLPSYSPYNPFVWIRLAARRLDKLKLIGADYRRQFRKLLESVEDIEQEFEKIKLKPREKERVFDLLYLEEKIRSFTNFSFDLINLIGPLRLAFLTDFKISKNNFLSLITINHDCYHPDGEKNETMKYINELPEELSFEDVQEAAFVYKLEHDMDCYLFDIFFNEMMEALSSNKELSDKVFEGFQEIVGPIQTYTAVTNEKGEVISTKPNKPNLKIVTNK